MHGIFKSARHILTKNALTFSLLRVIILSFNFIVAHMIITSTHSSSTRNMDDNLKYIVGGLLSTNGPVAINTVQKSYPSPFIHVSKHDLPDGNGVTHEKRTEGYTISENAARTPEKPKHTEYRKEENERLERKRRE